MALSGGVILQLFSYVPYAAALVPPEGETGPALDTGLVGIALLVAPIVFASVALISRSSDVLRRVMRSMAALVVFGLVIGLLSPVVGAAAGFGVGFALSLNMPAFEGQLRRRLLAVGLVLVYMSIMLALIPPAGVLAGALLPGPIVGFADEFGAWRETRSGGGPANLR